MTEPSVIEQRLLALQASRAANEPSGPPMAPPSAPPSAPLTSPSTSARPKKQGPAPARIVAAAASVAAGIGLVTLMAGAQQDIVVQVNPTPITVQPASVIVEMQSSTGEDTAPVEVRVVEAAVPAERPAPKARVVTQSEGS